MYKNKKGTVLWLSLIYSGVPTVAGIRNVELTRRLAKRGYDIVVVTPRRSGNRQEGTKNRVIIEYTRRDIESICNQWSHWNPLLYIAKGLLPDPSVDWIFTSIRNSKKMMREKTFDLVYTSCPPYSLCVAGHYLSKKYGIKWVTDFRDLWTMTPYAKLTPWNLYRSFTDRLLEPFFMANCDGFIANTQNALKRMVANYPLLAGKSTVIPNGYNAEFLKSGKRSIKNSGRINFLFSGSLHRIYSPVHFFQIIKRILKNKAFRSPIEVAYAGKDERKFELLLNQENLDVPSLIHGFRSTEKYYEILWAADFVFLMVPERADTRSWIPGRTYDYIGMRKNIICLANRESEVASLMKSYGRSAVLFYDETIDIHAEKCLGFIENHDRFKINEELVKKCSRESQAVNLDMFFENVLNP
jgi:glycosyltransferase involved in cell wall biosynthesis